MKPEFLTHPEAWTRTSRTLRSDAEYACAVSCPPSRGEWLVHDLIVAAILVGTLAWLFV